MAHPFMQQQTPYSDPFLRLVFTIDEIFYKVPSDRAIDEICHELQSSGDPDYVSHTLQALIAESNRFVLMYPGYESDPTTSKLLQHLEYVCNTAGFHPIVGRMALAIVSWYSRIETGRKGRDASYREACQMYYCAEALLIHNPKNPLFRPKELDHLVAGCKTQANPLLRFGEYREALALIKSAGNAGVVSFYENPTLEALSCLLGVVKAHKERALEHYSIPDFLPRRSQCPYCKRIFAFELAKSLGKHCENEKCCREHAAKQKRESRSNSPKTPDGWSKKFNPTLCDGCKEKRVLNSDRLCKSCFQESHCG